MWRWKCISLWYEKTQTESALNNAINKTTEWTCPSMCVISWRFRINLVHEMESYINLVTWVIPERLTGQKLRSWSPRDDGDTCLCAGWSLTRSLSLDTWWSCFFVAEKMNNINIWISIGYFWGKSIYGLWMKSSRLRKERSDFVFWLFSRFLMHKVNFMYNICVNNVAMIWYFDLSNLSRH